MQYAIMNATQKQALAVRCPTGSAEPGEKCERSTLDNCAPKPHRDRRRAAFGEITLSANTESARLSACWDTSLWRFTPASSALRKRAQLRSNPIFAKSSVRKVTQVLLRYPLAMAPDGNSGWRMGSNPTEKQQNDNDKKDESYSSSRGITPILAMRPPWQDTKKC
jgi:hypothetical protein